MFKIDIDFIFLMDGWISLFNVRYLRQRDMIVAFMLDVFRFDSDLLHGLSSIRS